MSLEKVLNLTATQKPKIVDQKDARRGRLISRIEGQLALIDAIKGGMNRPSQCVENQGGFGLRVAMYLYASNMLVVPSN